MHKKLALLLAVITLSGCVHGTVSTATYTDPPQQPLFTVFSSDLLSLTERNITALIETKMSERGYTKAGSHEAANVAVLYEYSVGPGRTHVSSSPDFVWGGQKVVSTTVYPRFFQIVVVDLERSKLPEKIEIIWHGEVYSSGSSANISKLAGYFIDELFENFGTTVTNKSFFKVIE
jgi:hypothetical protein